MRQGTAGSTGAACSGTPTCALQHTAYSTFCERRHLPPHTLHAPKHSRRVRDKELEELGAQAAAAETAQLRARELESAVRELRAQLRRSEEEVATLQVRGCCSCWAWLDCVRNAGGSMSCGPGAEQLLLLLVSQAWPPLPVWAAVCRAVPCAACPLPTWHLLIFTPLSPPRVLCAAPAAGGGRGGGGGAARGGQEQPGAGLGL